MEKTEMKCKTKKVLILTIVLVIPVLLLAGCCTRVDPVTKVSTDTFGNCVTAAQELLCNPTPVQQAAAASVIAFITSGIDIGNIITPVPITATEVQLIFGIVQAGGCVLATDLQKALAWYASFVTALQTQTNATKMKGLKATMQPPDISALYNR
jgi:hypothetical protein